MKKREENISDRKLTIFLILAIFVSLVSLWTVFISTDFDLLQGGVSTVVVREEPSPSSAIIGLTISPNLENYRLFENATVK